MKKFRYERITRIAARLTDERHLALICPITQSHQIGKYMEVNDGGFDRWRDADLSYLAKCDSMIVVMMEGWETSQGVQAEIAFAKKKKIPIEYINDPFDVEMPAYGYMRYPAVF